MVINPTTPGPCCRCEATTDWMVADGPLDGERLCDPCQQALLADRLGPELYAQVQAQVGEWVARGQDWHDRWLARVHAQELHQDDPPAR